MGLSSNWADDLDLTRKIRLYNRALVCLAIITMIGAVALGAVLFLGR